MAESKARHGWMRVDPDCKTEEPGEGHGALAAGHAAGWFSMETSRPSGMPRRVVEAGGMTTGGRRLCRADC